MTFKEWVMALFGTKPDPPDTARAELDAKQQNLAGRLAALKGGTRDEVLSEAYRRARVLDEEQSFRGRP